MLETTESKEAQSHTEREPPEDYFHIRASKKPYIPQRRASLVGQKGRDVLMTGLLACF